MENGQSSFSGLSPILLAIIRLTIGRDTLSNGKLLDISDSLTIIEKQHIDSFLKNFCKVKEFLFSCKVNDYDFRLTKSAEPSPYSVLFALFALFLIGKKDYIENNKENFDEIIRINLKKSYSAILHEKVQPESNKAYMQLLTFSLSSLKILGTLDNDPLPEYTENIYTNYKPIKYLADWGALSGKPQSGNLAMFYAINLLHKRDYLNVEIQNHIDDWVELHLTNINANGFWGPSNIRPYLQFQNGYHQYEILSYLRVSGEHWRCAAEHVSLLADKNSHFAPYPGGGGCFDLDGIFFLTNDFIDTKNYKHILKNTLLSLILNQNEDGGFSESSLIGNTFPTRLISTAKHLQPFKLGFNERLKYAIHLLLPKHKRITTHWTQYSRQWNESDLWDTWFRLLAIAKIDLTLGLNLSRWNFIDYVGLGY